MSTMSQGGGSGGGVEPSQRYETVSECATHISEELQNRLNDPDADLYAEDEVELKFLQSKPTCFLILGKPTSGKTTLAKRLAAEWKCELISDTTLLQQALEPEAEGQGPSTEFGRKCKEILLRGEAIPEEMVFSLIKEKLETEEVKHHGYVLEGLPCIGEQHLSVVDQIEMVKALPLKPDFIINIKLPDKDLENRRVGLRVDPVTGDLYTVDVYAPEKPPPQPKRASEGEGEEEEEEEEEDFEEEAEDEGGLSSEIVERLVRRPEDITPHVDNNIKQYKANVLRLLEDYIIDHDQQKFIELDGNLNQHMIFGQLMSRLNCFVLRRAAVPMRLHDAEEEEVPDETDTDELMRSLAAKDMVAPRHRWKRSRWLRYCPVALKEGNLVQGKPDLAVAFLDKMYCLSTPEALEKFLKNPRPYLTPPQPRPPCKVSVIGPPLSGKTSLCALLAQKYNAKVLDMDELIKPRMGDEHQTAVNKVREETTETAIQAIKQKLQNEYELVLKEIEEKELEEAEQEKEEAEAEQEEEQKEEEEGDEKKEEEEDKGEEEEEQKEEEAKDEEEEEEEEREQEGEGEEEGDESKDEQETEAEDKPPPKPKREPPPPPPEVDATHPEVVALVNAAVADAEKTGVTLPPEVWIEVLQEAILNVEKDMREKNPDGPDNGGWIIDNFPRNRDQWTAALEKNLLPDEVICLQDSSDNGNFLVKRWYQVNKVDVDEKMRVRKEAEEAERKRKEEDERRRQEEEERKRREEEEARLKAEEEAKKAAAEEEGEQEEGEEEEGEEEEHVEEEEVSEKPEEPVKEEKAEVEKEMEQAGEQQEEEGEEEKPAAVNLMPPEGPELEAFKALRTAWDREWQNTSGMLAGSPADPTLLEVENLTEEELLAKTVTTCERHFQYVGWDYTGIDVDEEEEDAAAAAELEAEEATGEEEEDEEAEEQEEEDPNRAKTKPLGDVSYFCPVALKEQQVLWPGNPETAAKYRSKIYYFASEEARTKFLEDPLPFLPTDQPFTPPPIRLLLLGPRGAGKSLHGRHLAKKLGIFHIAFKERLQEMIIAKTKKKLGPEYEEDNQPEEEEDDDEEEDGEAGMTAPDGTVVPVDTDDKADKKDKDGKEEEEEVEVEYTEDEEAIKLNLESDEPLPNEVLEKILLDWWHKEPFKSTGFILEGFPRTAEEARFLQEQGLFADSAVVIAVDDSDVFGRLLPSKLDKWKAKRDRKLAKRAAKKEKARKKREETIQKRRLELLKEQAERRAEKAAERAAAKAEEEDDEDEEDEEVEEEEEEDEEDDIEAVLAEEFEDEEEEEDDEDETEEDASERMKNDLAELYDNDVNNLAAVQEMLEEMLVPKLEIDGGRKTHIVRYSLYKKMRHLVEYRHSIYERVLPLSERLAAKMLAVGYKQQSRFGRWCPVKLEEGCVMQPQSLPNKPLFPVAYRQHVYFLSSAQARDTFSQDPRKYINQKTPKPVVPIKVAVIGPPKSGKTTLSNRFVEEYGVVRLSVGEAVRQLVATQPRTDLAKQIESHARKGLTVPEELAVQALEIALMDMACQTRGFVLDGFPATARQMELMAERCIIPVRVIDLTCSSREVMVRATRDRYSNVDRAYAAHDSQQIMAVKLAAFNKEIKPIRQNYSQQHQNLKPLDAEHSKWWLWNYAQDITNESVQIIQNYLHRVQNGEAASIYAMCITPDEFKLRVGDYEHYCPVRLADAEELVDCTDQRDLKYAVEYRGYYYKLAGQPELDAFLKTPERYVPPLAPRPLPPPEFRPIRRTAEDVKKMFPIQVELRGYCPVTFLEGKCKYEAIVPGDSNLVVEYRERVYYFENEEKLHKFMRKPDKYWELRLPHKLPPPKEPVALTGLPMLGYLEQSASTAIIKALTAVGNFKPKFPFMSAHRSALVYLAFHLKAFNPKSSDYVRKKYKKKLDRMEDTCKLIQYLGDNMTIRYRDPKERPIDFDHKMKEFITLKSQGVSMG